MNRNPVCSASNSRPVRRIVTLPADPTLRLTTPERIHDLLRPAFAGLDREHLWRVDLDARDGLLGAELVSIGTVACAPCHPREVFAQAIVNRASRVILIHNHPTGDLEPSTTDLRAMGRLDLCGTILGIEVADHLIVSEDRFSSVREREVSLRAGRGVGLERRRIPAILLAPGQRHRRVTPAKPSSRRPRSRA